MSRLTPLRLAACAAILAATFTVSAARAQATAPAATMPATTSAVVDPKAADVLHKLTDYYKTLKSASATIDSSMKFTGAGRDDSMKTSTSLAVERPNKLSVVVTDEKSGGGTAVSDGKNLSLSIPALKRYATEAAPASMDALIDSPVAEVAQHSNIVLVLFSADAYSKLLDGVSKVSYVGQDDIDGKKYDHLHLEQEQLDFDVWSAVGDQPLVRRIKPDVSRQIKMASMEMPQLKDARMDAVVEVKEWKLNEPGAPDRFAFTAPAGATKAPTLVEIFRPAREPMQMPMPEESAVERRTATQPAPAK